MKKLLMMMLFASLTAIGSAQVVKLTIEVQFVNIEEGYDHMCKNKIYIDGKEVTESPETLESKKLTFTVTVPTGEHKFKLVNLAKYEGNWEEHTVANNYSIDCMLEETRSFIKKEKLYVVFDINKETLYSWGRPVERK